MKYLYALIVILVVCAGFVYDRKSYGSSQYKLGVSDTLKAQTNTDNIALIAQSQIMVDAFQATQRQMNELFKSPDPSSAPASIQSTFASLCDQRKAHGVPCGPARPSVKPNVQ